MLKRRHTSLSIVVTGDEPPSEFCIFTAGKVETTKGTFTFDEAAATSVMQEYAAHGIDLMIDYDHASLDVGVDPALSGKAAGWFNIELRDGALWAFNVRWTPAAAAALKAKEWRFYSPAFGHDDGRITDLLNVAVTNLPATRQLEPLMAASRTRLARDLRMLSVGTSFDAIRSALDAALRARFPADPSADCLPSLWVADVYDATAVYELDGKLFEVSYTFDGTTAALAPTAIAVERKYVPVAQPTAPAPPVATTKKRTAKLAASRGNGMTLEEFAKVCKALGIEGSSSVEDALAKIRGEGPAEEPAEPEAPEAAAAAAAPEEPPAAMAEDPAAEVAAALSTIARLSGKSFVASVADIKTWHASHIALETERQKLASDRSTLEAAERRQGCVELVTLGGRAPATVWADDKATAPKKYLSAMSIEDFRDYVADAKGTKGGKVAASVKPPTTGTGAHNLTAEELAICASMKCDPAAFAALKNQRDGVKTGAS